MRHLDPPLSAEIGTLDVSATLSNSVDGTESSSSGGDSDAGIISAEGDIESAPQCASNNEVIGTDKTNLKCTGQENAPARKWRVPTCSACKNPGHTARSRHCPKYSDQSEPIAAIEPGVPLVPALLRAIAIAADDCPGPLEPIPGPQSIPMFASLSTEQRKAALQVLMAMISNSQTL